MASSGQEASISDEPTAMPPSGTRVLAEDFSGARRWNLSTGGQQSVPVNPSDGKLHFTVQPDVVLVAGPRQADLPPDLAAMASERIDATVDTADPIPDGASISLLCRLTATGQAYQFAVFTNG
jgi:hypothetical protein